MLKFLHAIFRTDVLFHKIHVQKNTITTYKRLTDEAIKYIEERGLENNEHFQDLYAKMCGANSYYDLVKGEI